MSQFHCSISFKENPYLSAHVQCLFALFILSSSLINMVVHLSSVSYPVAWFMSTMENLPAMILLMCEWTSHKQSQHQISIMYELRVLKGCMPRYSWQANARKWIHDPSIAELLILLEVFFTGRRLFNCWAFSVWSSTCLVSQSGLTVIQQKNGVGCELLWASTPGGNAVLSRLRRWYHNCWLPSLC